MMAVLRMVALLSRGFAVVLVPSGNWFRRGSSLGARKLRRLDGPLCLSSARLPPFKYVGGGGGFGWGGGG